MRRMRLGAGARRVLLRALVVSVIALLGARSLDLLARRWATATANPLDFAMCMSSLHLMLHRVDPYRVSRYDLRSEVPREVWASVRHFDPHYLPSALTPLLPYTVLEFDDAVRAWWITNAIAAAALLAGLFRLAPRPIDPLAYPLVAVVLVAGSPFQITLANGQNPLVALALLVWAIVAADGRHRLLAGVLLALSMLKYHLVLPAAVPLFLRADRRAALALAAAAHLAAHVAWSAWIGSDPITVLLDVTALNRRVLAYDGIDILSVARRCGAALGIAAAAPLLAAAALTALAGLLWRLWLRSRDSLPTLGWLSVWITVSLAVAYHRPYDFVALVVPLVWVVTTRGNRTARGLVVAGIALLFLRGVLSEALWFSAADAGRWRWLLDAGAFYAVVAGVLLLAHRLGGADAAAATS